MDGGRGLEQRIGFRNTDAKILRIFVDLDQSYWTVAVFLLKHFLLFYHSNVAAGHMSEDHHNSYSNFVKFLTLTRFEIKIFCEKVKVPICIVVSGNIKGNFNSP